MNDDLRNEVLYGRDQNSLRVFVSSRMDGTLDDERIAAASAINELPTHDAWTWESHAPAGVLHSENECVLIAGKSDELVLLLARDLSAITEAEYRAAQQNGLQRYIFIRTTLGDVQDDHVKSFISSERDNRIVTRNFSNTGELKTHLQNSLRSAQIRASREQMLMRRQTVQLGENK